jgi:hypothetical protein
MNENDYDEDGNCIVPCPLCLDVHCPANQFDQNGNKRGDVKCPEEEAFVRDMKVIDYERKRIRLEVVKLTELFSCKIAARKIGASEIEIRRLTDDIVRVIKNEC